MKKHSEVFRKLENIVERALSRNIASSISLAVSGPFEQPVIIHRGIVDKHATNDNTLYDLASLTKIIGTTMAVAHAIERGIFRRDDLPFLQWPRGSIEALLAHRAGLPAHRRFYEECSLSTSDFQSNRATIFERLFETIAQEDCTRRLYSDLGFMALGFLLEEHHKKPLFEIFCDAWRACSLAIPFTWFPSQCSSRMSTTTNIAPTGYCPARNAYVRAQVHDPNCYFLGGLAGHAGLFGSLSAVDRVGRFFLRAALNPNTPLEYLLRLFAQRGLGFDKPTLSGTTRYFSPSAFGHFGYTDTSLWIDPAFNNCNGIVVSLLTNRVHKSEKPEGIFWLRLAINRALQN